MTRMSDLILVNERDEEIGTAGVLECHAGSGVLHRAFTIFIFNESGELLIQRRSEGKLLWPLIWETSCSGHPRKGEGLIRASKKRLFQELGVRSELEVRGRFTYRERYCEVGSEYELCYVLTGDCRGEVNEDPQEVSEYRWIGTGELEDEISAAPEQYAPWLVLGLDFL